VDEQIAVAARRINAAHQKYRGVLLAYRVDEQRATATCAAHGTLFAVCIDVYAAMTARGVAEKSIKA